VWLFACDDHVHVGEDRACHYLDVAEASGKLIDLCLEHKGRGRFCGVDGDLELIAFLVMSLFRSALERRGGAVHHKVDEGGSAAVGQTGAGKGGDNLSCGEGLLKTSQGIVLSEFALDEIFLHKFIAALGGGFKELAPSRLHRIGEFRRDFSDLLFLIVGRRAHIGLFVEHVDDAFKGRTFSHRNSDGHGGNLEFFFYYRQGLRYNLPSLHRVGSRTPSLVFDGAPTVSRV